ncbi:MAG: MBL fold metallo-hydrolase [Acidobacteriia bacterium]|nr:MBL fold metallo-hydrolase [Terriglobia bacterium]
MKLTFRGAAQTVTGSLHEVTVDGQRLLLDCGLYQGKRKDSFERNRHLPWPGSSVDSVILSHAHIDHSGNLPSLGRDGYSGPIHTTAATADLCGTMLPDSAYLQERDVDFVMKRQRRRRKLQGQENGEDGLEPLYRLADVEAILPLFQHVRYSEAKQLSDTLSMELFDAGHLLGSACVRLTHRQQEKTQRLVFSGDVGRCCLPILRDPAPMPECDYLIMESTYGNRLHSKEQLVMEKLADVVNRTCERGGRLIVPAFAVGRTQQLVLMLHQLTERKAIPNMPIFVDSPMALNATEAYRRHPECYDEETRAFLENGNDPFGFSRLRYVRDVSESKGLNDLRGPFVVISASGMCEAGRILHHLRNNITDSKNTVLITGFQAEHTLGRRIVEKQTEVSIFGEPVRLRAEVAVLNELSGHADQGELMEWIKPHARQLKGVFLVHGELEQSQPLAALIRETYGVDVHIPARGDHFTLQ